MTRTNWIAGVLLTIVLMSSAGCLIVPYPHVRQDIRARNGRVVDADTGSPLAGAVVTSLTNGSECVTDAEGRFTLPEVRGWHFGRLITPPLSYDIWPFLDIAPSHQVRIVAVGFAPFDEHNGSRPTQRGREEMLMMERLVR
jgi:hypothetical protein